MMSPVKLEFVDANKIPDNCPLPSIIAAILPTLLAVTYTLETVIVCPNGLVRLTPSHSIDITAGQNPFDGRSGRTDGTP